MNKWLKVGVILIVLALFFVPTILALKYLTISQIYSHFVDSIYNLTGFNKYLVKAVVVLLMIPLIIGIKFVLSPFNKKRKYIGIAILVTLISLYNFIKKMFFLIFGFMITYTLSVSNYSFAYEKEIKDLSVSMSVSSKKIGCHVIITNLGKDRRIYLNASNSPQTRIIDNLGNEYTAGEVQIGKSNSPFYVPNTFVSGIPTKVSFVFEDVSVEANSLALLEIGCENGGKFTAQIRNIPLSK